MTDKLHHVVVIGGGFGGLQTARSLRKTPVRVTLVDRRNFHLFQPLLYQVATGSLSPAKISAPVPEEHRRRSADATTLLLPRREGFTQPNGRPVLPP